MKEMNSPEHTQEIIAELLSLKRLSFRDNKLIELYTDIQKELPVGFDQTLLKFVEEEDFECRKNLFIEIYLNVLCCKPLNESYFDEPDLQTLDFLTNALITEFSEIKRLSLKI
jgi:hypothetical protein